MKKYLFLSIALSLSVNLFAEGVSSDQNISLVKEIKELKKSLAKVKQELLKVKAHDAKDNIKFSVDFRTSLDILEYKSAKGRVYKNDSLFSNRLWLNMGYAASKNMVFRGQLSYNKAYGASPKMKMGINQRGSSHSYDVFDWVTNESLTTDTIKIKEAYWLYMNDTFFGKDIHWTASFGRRPSVNGFLVNLRDDDKASSPLGHMINMEFDGASFKFVLEKIVGISGMYLKFCLGRGLTNARARFNMDTGLDASGDYTNDKNILDDVDLAGFIFVPYDDGQYKLMFNYYRGFDVPGFVMADAHMFSNPNQDGMITSDMKLNQNLSLKNLGDMDGAAVSLLIDGIGDGINDFLDDTKFFVSLGLSKSLPNNNIVSMSNAVRREVAQAGGVAQMQAKIDEFKSSGKSLTLLENGMSGKEGMLGSNDEKTGTSYWIGLQMPFVISEDGRLGLEYNHGSKYWRPFTYGEDTMIGSKLAVRGDAYEAYYIQPLTKAFSMQLRYTKIDYNYTGSQGFFGATGIPMSMDEAKMFGMDPIKEAEDIRVSFRYRF